MLFQLLLLNDHVMYLTATQVQILRVKKYIIIKYNIYRRRVKLSTQKEIL